MERSLHTKTKIKRRNIRTRSRQDGLGVATVTFKCDCDREIHTCHPAKDIAIIHIAMPYGLD